MDAVRDVGDREATLLFGDRGVELDLVQQVAEFLDQVGVGVGERVGIRRRIGVERMDGIDDLVLRRPAGTRGRQAPLLGCCFFDRHG